MFFSKTGSSVIELSFINTYSKTKKNQCRQPRIPALCSNNVFSTKKLIYIENDFSNKLFVEICIQAPLGESLDANGTIKNVISTFSNKNRSRQNKRDKLKTNLKETASAVGIGNTVVKIIYFRVLASILEI